MGGMGGQNQFLTAGLNDPNSGYKTQGAWSGLPDQGTQIGQVAWPPGQPGGFMSHAHYDNYGYNGSYYGTPHGQTPGQQHMHPNYQHGAHNGQQGQYMEGMQGQIGYQSYGQDQWYGHDQYRHGHVGDGIDGMDSTAIFFQNISTPSFRGNKAPSATEPSPSADGRGGAGAEGVGLGPSGTAAGGGKSWPSGGHGGDISSSDYHAESEESRNYETGRRGNEQDHYSGGTGQARPPKPQPPQRRKSKNHRGVSAVEMREIFQVLVSLGPNLVFVSSIMP